MLLVFKEHLSPIDVISFYYYIYLWVWGGEKVTCTGLGVRVEVKGQCGS